MNSLRLFPIFILVMLGLLFFVQYFFFTKITGFLKSTKKPTWLRKTTYVVFALFNVPLVILLLWRPHFTYFPEWFLFAGVYPFYVWHFTLLILLIAYLLFKIVQFPFVLVRWLLRKLRQSEQNASIPLAVPDPSRRTVLRNGLTVLAGATFVWSGYGAFHRNKYEITAVEIPVKNLPDVFQGFTIALISDIHSSVFMLKDKMQEYASVVNSLGADLIAVPGDFVNSTLDEVYPFAEAFSTLKAPYGVYGVLGNHDYFTRQVETVAKEVNACGIQLLRNTGLTVEKNGERIYLLGIDDTGIRELAMRHAMDAIDGKGAVLPKILLCHRPYFFEQFAAQQIDLTLSGHTHGGQVVFVKFGNEVMAPARMVSPYVSGLYSKGSSNMYVSRGIGTVGVPIRINCPPEITKIKLVKA